MIFKRASCSSNPGLFVTLSRAQILFRTISSLKVAWKKDLKLDHVILKDKQYKLCAKVVNEVLNEPGQIIPLRYLEKRRERLRLKVKAKTFVFRNPLFFDIYYDRIKPKTDKVQFLRVSDQLRKFLDEEKIIYEKQEELIVSKLCKLLMMTSNKVISVDKLLHVKREFGFPSDFLTNLIPKYPKYFRISGNGNRYLELVEWNKEVAKSVIEIRAEEEDALTGIPSRPNFTYKLPNGFFLKKGMREWVLDWLEMDYISPYEDVSHLDQSSREMEKRNVAVFHELLSLSLHKIMTVPILGKFAEDYRFSNDFSSVFTRHPGIFYMSLKGGIKTAMLREAFNGSELINKDPLHEIKEKFVQLVEDGWQKAKASNSQEEKDDRDDSGQSEELTITSEFHLHS